MVIKKKGEIRKDDRPLTLTLSHRPTAWVPRGGDVTWSFGGSIFFHGADMHYGITTEANAENFRFPPTTHSVGTPVGEG